MDETFDPQAVARKLAFFNIGQADMRRFPGIAEALRRHAPPALDALYEQVAATPETAKFFNSQGAMRHARDKQIEHWAGMFGGTVDKAYFQSAERIGNVHARIGLEPGWYIGAYAAVLERIINAMSSGISAYSAARRTRRPLARWSRWRCSTWKLRFQPTSRPKKPHASR